MRAFTRVHGAFTEIGAAIAAICVAVTACIYTGEVIARYLLNAPLNWSGDVSSYLLCASTFLALPKVTSDGGHIAISYFLETMRETARARYAMALRLFAGAVCLMTVVYVATEGVQLFSENVLTTQATQIPKWLIALVACIGLASSSLHLLLMRGNLGKDAAL